MISWEEGRHGELASTGMVGDCGRQDDCRIGRAVIRAPRGWGGRGQLRDAGATRGEDHEAREAIDGGQEEEFEKTSPLKSINECFYLNCKVNHNCFQYLLFYFR